jgi:hypothetical protein
MFVIVGFEVLTVEVTKNSIFWNIIQQIDLMFLTANLKRILSTECVGHTKFHMPNSNNSFSITIKPKAKY